MIVAADTTGISTATRSLHNTLIASVSLVDAPQYGNEQLAASQIQMHDTASTTCRPPAPWNLRQLGDHHVFLGRTVELLPRVPSVFYRDGVIKRIDALRSKEPQHVF
jgi:hypothetical protein